MGSKKSLQNCHSTATVSQKFKDWVSCFRGLTQASIALGTEHEQRSDEASNTVKQVASDPSEQCSNTQVC